MTGLITNQNVTNTAAAIPTSALAGRKTVRVWNPVGNAATIYVGYGSGVTAGAPSNGGAQGTPVAPGQSVTFSVAASKVLYAIAPSAGPFVVQVEELG